MLETLTRGFESARERLQGVRALTEENIDEALRDVRMSLLEADVDFQVVKDFLGRVKERGLGEKVETRVKDAQGRSHRVTPGQHFVKICEEELAALMGPVDTELKRGNGGVVSVMLLGLQGVGKTTVAAMLEKMGVVKDGDHVIITKGDLMGTGGGTNAMKIVTVGSLPKFLS